ncbi:type II toxin-antitoxin system VapC family toxin [Nocardioides humi]|uniref:Ribonuclease VapC n=1 Tax=Nocardioides humi TaxID=449461 RepID=A0ABN2AMA7_9ACTN|nr:type II toxin-antitoxin system VapC family toxin [Nocardioides humi]
MKAYVDSSAFVKLLVGEPESPALIRYLDQQPDDFQLVSSLLLETEVRRAARANLLDQAAVTAKLTSVTLLDAEHPIFTSAGLLSPAELRSLDALHLATALDEGVDVLIAYDRRLLDAATVHGITTTSPV